MTNPTPEHLAKLAEGLTAAQRRAVVGAQYHEWSRQWRCHAAMPSVIRKLCLAELVCGAFDRLTPLGLAVRARIIGGEGQAI